MTCERYSRTYYSCACLVLGVWLFTLSFVANTQTVNVAQDVQPNSTLSVPQHFDVQGHRGARSVLPENTLPAFMYALEIGVDTLELDLATTDDRQVVIVHDQVVNQTICKSSSLSAEHQKAWIHDLTLEQVKSFDCGSYPHPGFPQQVAVPNTKIPTLAELFEAVAQSGLSNRDTVRFNIETKSNPANPAAQAEPKEFVELVLQVVDKFDLRDRITLQSFDHRTLVEAHRQAPEVKRAALFRTTPDDWLVAAEAAHADIVSPRGNLIDAQSVAQMQSAGYLVIPWTANTQAQWRALISMGVDGIITDDPEPLLQLLGRR